jgi:hypothetical protein
VIEKPFRVQRKIDIISYVRDIDSFKWNKWLQELEVHFSVHEVSEAYIISFCCLKLEGHDLKWWENDAIDKRLGNELLMIKWEVFKDMIESNSILLFTRWNKI